MMNHGKYLGNQDRNLPLFGCWRVNHGKFPLWTQWLADLCERASSLCTTVTRPGKGKVWPGSFSVVDWSNWTSWDTNVRFQRTYPHDFWRFDGSTVIYWDLRSEGLRLQRRQHTVRLLLAALTKGCSPALKRRKFESKLLAAISKTEKPWSNKTTVKSVKSIFFSVVYE